MPKPPLQIVVYITTQPDPIPLVASDPFPASSQLSPQHPWGYSQTQLASLLRRPHSRPKRAKTKHTFCAFAYSVACTKRWRSFLRISSRLECPLSTSSQNIWAWIKTPISFQGWRQDVPAILCSSFRWLFYRLSTCHLQHGYHGLGRQQMITSYNCLAP